jgi:hypothetical protein
VTSSPNPAAAAYAFRASERLDLPVEKRLRRRRVLDLAVPVAPEPDHVDDDVGREGDAELVREPSRAHDRLGVCPST